MLVQPHTLSREMTMSTAFHRLSVSSDLPHHDALCLLERGAAAGPYADDPTALFLEPLGMEVWRLRVTAGQLALPSSQQ